MDYLVSGDVIFDRVHSTNSGEADAFHLGGMATYAYSGVKMWTDSVFQVSNVGPDFKETAKDWIERNNVDMRGFMETMDESMHTDLYYGEDGQYSAGIHAAPLNLRSWEDGRPLNHPSADVVGRRADEVGGVKGVYLCYEPNPYYWAGIGELKKRYGTKVLWEIEAPACHPECLEAVRYILPYVDVLSINHHEARDLFDVETDEECIEKLKEFDVDLVLFRVGKRGLYTVTKDETWYLPPAPSEKIVDQTGCGNCSTGACLYAYCEGMDALDIGITANVAAAYNIQQFGVADDLVSNREKLFRKVKELRNEYLKVNNVL